MTQLAGQPASPNGQAPLLLSRLSISRMAGLPVGFELTQLSPGVNLIFGPNGVGKSRTARAINLALWPAEAGRGGGAGARHRDAVTAEYSIGRERWLVEVDADTVHWQEGGVPSAGPALAGGQECDRYNLALKELLGDDPASLAASIAREAAGGYDLSAAAAALGIGGKKPALRQAVGDAARQAAGALRDAQYKAAALHGEEAELQKLEQERAQARAVAARLPMLQQAIALADARRSAAAALEALAVFDPVLQQLSGTELSLLQQLRGDWEKLLEEQTQTQRDRQSVLLSMQQQAMGDITAADEAIPAAAAAVAQQIEHLQHQILDQQRIQGAAQSRRERALMAVGATDPAVLSHLTPATLQRLSTAATEVELATLQLRAVEAQEKALQTAADAGDAAVEPSRLQSGVLLLNQWLSEPADASPLAEQQPWALPAAAVCIVLLSLLLAWFTHWAVALAALAGPALWVLGRRTTPAPAGLRASVAQRYAALALAMPDGWTDEQVGRHVAVLGEQLAAAQQRRLAAEALARLQGPLQAAREQHKLAEAARSALQAELRFSVPADAVSLRAMGDALAKLRDDDEQLAAAEAALHPLLAEQRALLASAAEPLRRFGYEPTTAAELASAATHLQRRLEAQRQAALRLQSLSAALAEQQQRLGVLQQRIEQLFASVGLSGEQDEPTLRRWHGQRPAFEAARSRHQVALARIAELERAVDPQLADIPREMLIQQLSEAEQSAAHEPEVAEKIVAIRTRMDAAKHGHEVEVAAANWREAEANLLAQRTAACESAAGWVLVQHLRRNASERDRPPLLRAAAELFSRITRGRYRLEIASAADGRAATGFIAIDTETGAGHCIEQLSAGTRVQLLLAVRVAFVQQQERGLRCPLILDEALANSDQRRAREIIDALVEICRDGRQIFYFTAQFDEVAKWREILQQDGRVPFQLIDLAAVRGQAASQQMPLRPAAAMPDVSVPPPPAHNDRDHYAKQLNVPGIDPRQDVGGVHLWHLVEDLSLLHRLLSMGISSWGQWQALVNQGGAAAKVDARGYAAAAARAKALAALMHGWAVGRGRPMDRFVLADCKALSERFLDETIALAAQEQWDARRLVERLAAKALRGFRGEKLDQLRAYLSEQGYLDDRPTLDRDQLRVRALAAVASEMKEGTISAAQVDAYLNRWFAGDASAAGESEQAAAGNASRAEAPPMDAELLLVQSDKPGVAVDV